MKLQEADMISRFTQATSRNLVLFSSAISMVILFDLNAEEWSLFKDKNIGPNEFILISCIIIIYLMASHIVHWWSDYISYTKWFKKNETVIGTSGSAGAFKNTHPVSVGLVKRIEKLKKSTDNANDKVCELDVFTLEDIQKHSGDRNVSQDLETLRTTVASNKESIERQQAEISDLFSLLHNIGPGFTKMKWASRIVIVVWYLLIPVILGFAALYLLYCPFKL